MRVRIVSIGDIDDAMVSRWNAWASPGGRLVSPYLRFEFTRCIARVRDDVRIAVFEDAGQIIGFFPHHAAREGVVRPIGAALMATISSRCSSPSMRSWAPGSGASRPK